MRKIEELMSIPKQIFSLKQQLAKTDYKAIKYAEGWMTEEEYAETKVERQRIRDEINRLQRLNT